MSLIKRVKWFLEHRKARKRCYASIVLHAIENCQTLAESAKTVLAQNQDCAEELNREWKTFLNSLYYFVRKELNVGTWELRVYCRKKKG